MYRNAAAAAAAALGAEPEFLARREAGLDRRRKPSDPARYGEGRAVREEGQAVVAALGAACGHASPRAAHP